MTSKEVHDLLRLTRREELGVLAAAALMLMSQSCVAEDTTIDTKAGTIKVETIAHGLENPWGLAFLPDDRMLVTERPGRLRIVTKDGTMSGPLKGVPEVFAEGQGGLFDVKLDPDFATNRLVYIAYSEPGDGGAGTAVARGKLGTDSLDAVEVIFRQHPKVDGPNHFGGRLVFATDGKLFVSLGERFTFTPAQDLSNDLGKVVRINPDGSVPKDNPFVGHVEARPEIWTYGHRNPQGLAFDPRGRLWETEHGPRGGDELNIIEKGKNYGWPVVAHGIDYPGTPIGDGSTHKEGMEEPVYYWDPVIAPSGLAFYTGNLFPQWKNSVFVGGLRGMVLVRLTIANDKVVSEEPLLTELNTRIRDVRVGPDGAVYVLTDSGTSSMSYGTPLASKLLKLTPK